MKQLATLNKYFWKYRWRFTLGIAFVILTNYFRILSPQLAGHVVNTVVSKLNNGGELNSAKLSTESYDLLVRTIINVFEAMPFERQILISGLLLIGLAIISGFFMFLMRQTIIVMSRFIEYDQKNEIFEHYQKLDSAFFKMQRTGDLMNRISEDVSRVRMYTGPAIMYFINLATVIGFSIYFMARSDLKLTLVALSPLPILAVTIYFVNSIINRKSERIQQLLSKLTTNAQESYAGIRVIKSFAEESAMAGYFEKNSDNYRKNALSLARTEAIYFPSMAFIIGLSTLMTILIGGMDVLHAVPGASVGKIAEFVMYIQMLTFPVSAIGWTASITQRAIASQERINEFLHTEPSIVTEKEAKKIVLNGSIRFEGVRFTYPITEIEAIKDFTLDIMPGEHIAIVGKTGSGKSTLAQLLLRMYDVSSGIIYFNNQPIQQIDLSALRSQICYVPQEVFLFSDSIANNIRFGKHDATQQEIREAAERAGILPEIEEFAQGFETMVGERGVTLSGGQKQRISIARALIRDPEIVLFDDCLSAVDGKTEKLILDNLFRYMKNKTAIIITHRANVAARCSRIIVLDNGRIVEIGTHKELLLSGSVYANMFQTKQIND